eukprot:jgi/Botrbrau1/703/Bobra.160_2s0026.1
MDFASKPLEDASRLFFAEQNVFTDAVGLSVAARAYLVPYIWEHTPVWDVPGFGAVFGFLGMYTLLRLKSVARWRNFIVTMLWLSVSFLTLLRTLKQTTPVETISNASPLVNGLFWSWPQILSMVLFLRLTLSYTPFIQFPCLVVIQLSTMQRLCALQSVTASDPQFQSRQSLYNRTLSSVFLQAKVARNTSEPYQPPLVQLSFEQWAALYLLLVQAMAFWGALWLLAMQERLLRCRLTVKNRLPSVPPYAPQQITIPQMMYVHTYISGLLFYYVTYESFKISRIHKVCVG